MKLNYRADIDGLRALAVTAVVLFHSEISIFGEKVFNGGFIGVDIFFVISGYLISGIILGELHLSNNFKFYYFLEKRARRLLPALFTFILVSIPFAFYNLSQIYFDEFINSVYSAISFVSNIYFYYNSEYFNAPYYLKPLLHTWSLSIEIQFYLFFPLLIILLWKKIKLLITTLSILILLNILLVQFGGNLNIHYPYIENSFIFFNPPVLGTFFWTTSRIWEFLFGALIFVFSKKYKIESNTLISILGILLIFLSLFIFYHDVNNPSVINLLPVIGTGLLLIETKKENVVNNILQNKYLVFIGLISYSTYLFHFLVFSFYEGLIINRSEDDLYIKIFLIILSYIIGFISFKFIEIPFRKKNFKVFNFFYYFIFIICLLILFFGYFSNEFKKKSKTNIYSNYPSINFEILPLDYKKSIELKSFSSTNKKKFLIIGDSHAFDLYKILKLNPKLNVKNEFIYQEYEIYNFLKNRKIIERQKVFQESEFIILTSDYAKDDIEILESVIKKLKSKNKKIILSSHTADYDVIEAPVVDILLRTKRILNKEEMEKKLFLSLNHRKIKENKIIKGIAEKNNIIYFNKLSYACDLPKKICFTTDKSNNLINYDKTHITIEGARFFGKSFYIENFFDKLKF